VSYVVSMYGSIRTIPFGKGSDYGMRATFLKDGLKVATKQQDSLQARQRKLRSWQISSDLT
jgi:hypothetical protein